MESSDELGYRQWLRVRKAAGVEPVECVSTHPGCVRRFEDSVLRLRPLGFAVLFGDGSGWWGLVGGFLRAFLAQLFTSCSLVPCIDMSVKCVEKGIA